MFVIIVSLWWLEACNNTLLPDTMMATNVTYDSSSFYSKPPLGWLRVSREILGIIGPNPSVSKSNQLHVGIFCVFFVKFEGIFHKSFIF